MEYMEYKFKMVATMRGSRGGYGKQIRLGLKSICYMSILDPLATLASARIFSIGNTLVAAAACGLNYSSCTKKG